MPESIPRIGLQSVTSAKSGEDVGRLSSPAPPDHLIPQEDAPKAVPEEPFHQNVLGPEHRGSKPRRSSKVLELFSSQSKHLDEATVTVMLKPPQPPPKPKKPSSKAKKPSSKAKKPSSRAKKPSSETKSSSEVQFEDLREEEELPAAVPGPELPLTRAPRGFSPEPQKPSREGGLVERAPEPRRPSSQVVLSDRAQGSSSTEGVANHRQMYKAIIAHLGDALTILRRYYTQGKDKKAKRASNDPLTVRTKDHRTNLYKKLIDLQEEAKIAIGQKLNATSACCKNGQAQSDEFVTYFKNQKVARVPPVFTHVRYAHCRLFFSKARL